MRPSLLGLALAVLLSACGSKPTLGSAERKVALLSPTFNEASTQVTGFEFVLQYNWGIGSGCLELSDQAKATVNGVPVDDLFLGGDDHVPGFIGSACQPPSFRVPLSAADVDELTLVLEDGEDRVEAVALNPGRPLGVTLTPPAGGHIRAGSKMGLTWSPGTDKVDQMFGWFTGAGGMSRVVSDFEQGLTIPTDAETGPATLLIEVRQMGVGRCEGIETCDFSYTLLPDQFQAPFRQVKVPITVEP